MDAEKIIREIPTEEKILRSSRRVRVFTMVDCISALSKKGYDANGIKKMIQGLLDSFKIVKVVKCSNNPSSVDLAVGRSLSATDAYMWAEERTNYLSIITGIAIVFFILFLVMFQMWPMWLKRLAGYIKYPLLGFIGFLVISAIVRLVVFGITMFTHPPGLWLLPNLFADCGFFESFVPLYCWANQDSSHKKIKTE